MPLEWRRLVWLLSLISYTLTAGLGILYLYQGQNVILLTALLALFISNGLWAVQRLKYRLIHLLFQTMIFIFLVSRPLIDYLRHRVFDSYQLDVYPFAFTVVGISLIGLAFGGMLGERLFVPYQQKQSKKLVAPPLLNTMQLRVRQTMQWVALGGWALTYPFYLLRLIERWQYRRQTTYYDYYATFHSQLPYFTYILSAFMFYFLCLYLATKPRKLHATFVLIAYIMANAIHLLIGTRNPVMLAILFSFMYYFMREQEEKGKWIGLKERIAMVIATPLLVLFMGMMNYLRDNVAVKTFDVWELFVDFLYKQGTSFKVLASGYLYQWALPNLPFRSYLVGTFGEYFYRGNIGQLLFGTQPIQNTTNSLELALETNSYAHNLSYIVLKQEYLEGHGIGSSYMMEAYADFGMWGVFLVSLCLGVLFIWMMQTAYTQKLLAFTIQLLILSNLFFMPRSSFAESFYPLITAQFWFIIILTFAVTYMTVKPIRQNNQKEEK